MPNKIEDISTNEGQPKNLEIERKFLIRSVPENLEQFPSESLRQGYVLIGQEGSLRVREQQSQEGERCWCVTIKKGKGLTRTEIEMPISEDQFTILWQGTDGRRVEKRRYILPSSDGLSIELDVYEGSLAGLKTAEVEFKTETQAMTFTPPSWFGKDVTEDTRYSNATLATNGIPIEDAPIQK